MAAVAVSSSNTNSQEMFIEASSSKSTMDSSSSTPPSRSTRASDAAAGMKSAMDSSSPSQSPTTRVSDASGDGGGSDSATSVVLSSTPDHQHHDCHDQANSSTLNPQQQQQQKDVEIQYSPEELKSEEYRQLFRLPPEEVLIQDFNCACQESILLQGHMYVFVHYICFYSNIFGFETKKIIPFPEITYIRRAKTAGIFPNAIEIIAGPKKYFFASFLSRDEAFMLINDGWLQHNSDAKLLAERQESNAEPCNENGVVIMDKFQSLNIPSNESESIDEHVDTPILVNPNPLPSVADENVSTGCTEVEDNVDGEAVPVLVTGSSASGNCSMWKEEISDAPDSKPSQVEDNVDEEAVPVLVTGSSASGNCSMWKEEISDAPEISGNYTRVATAKFPIKVEEFFNLFFSDAAADFLESFHKKCGDKDLKCSPWHSNDVCGHSRNVSFLHPIKIYFGARCGSCRETQKFRVYRNSHLVIETSQEILDVPYGDHFHVEGLWNLEGDGETCALQVYTNVAFSKRTIFKGKIVQNTLDECREAYATWIECAYELLKQKNLEKQEDEHREASVSRNNEVNVERPAESAGPLKISRESSNPIRIQQSSDSKEVEHRVGNILERSLIYVTPILSILKESMENFSALLRSRGHLPVLLVTFAAILLLMQFSIIVLLSRPAQVHMISQGNRISNMPSRPGEMSSEAVGWIEKRMHFLKEEMLMVESRIEQMRIEHNLMKTQLENLELYYIKKQL